MKIGWITDYNMESPQHGGAEITNEYMVEEARKRGHEVDYILPKDVQMAIVGGLPYDLFVINSVLDFNAYLNNIIDSGIPYVTYNHDFNFCVFRNADCELYKCDRCNYENSPALNWFIHLYERAELNIFLSPLHVEMTRNKIPSLSQTIAIPAPLDLTKFKKSKKVKKHKYIYFGNIYGGKGIKQIFNDFKGKEVHFVGQIWEPGLKEQIEAEGHKYLGEVNKDDVPKILQDYTYFIRYTKLKESFGRSTVEAIACGCKIVTNGNKIGADSFDMSNDNLIKACGMAPQIFWEKIETKLGAKQLNLLVLMGSGLGNIIQTTPLVNMLKEMGHNIDVAMWSSMPQSHQALDDWESVDSLFLSDLHLKNNKKKYDYIVETVHAKANQFKHLKGEVLNTKFTPAGKNDMEKNMEVLQHFTDKTILQYPPAHCGYDDGYKIPEGKYIVIANGSNNGEMWQRKKWPYYEDLVVMMPNHKFVMVGNKGENLKHKHDNVIDLTGKIELREALAVIKGAELFIGNDSGLTHCAAALDVKTIDIFGFTDVIKNAPYGNKVTILAKDLKCQPCQYNEKVWRACKDWKCIKGIKAITVKEVALKVLKGQTEITPESLVDDITQNNKFANKFFKKNKFTKKGAIKVCWLQQLQKLGGAELSNLTVLQGATDDFDIVPVTQHTFNEDVLEKCDVIIINNFWRFTPEQLTKLREVFNSGKMLVNYSHDHEAVLTREWEFIEGDTFKRTFMNGVFNNTILEAFISPFHYENHARYYKLNNPTCLPLAVDTKFFKSVKGVERDPKKIVCLVSGGEIPPSVYEHAIHHPEYDYHIYSEYYGAEYDNVDNMILHPPIDYFKLPELFSSASQLLFQPHVIHSGGRVVFEAALCGCEPIMNDNVGHKSWDLDWKNLDRKWLADAPKQFWIEVKEAIFKKINEVSNNGLRKR